MAKGLGRLPAPDPRDAEFRIQQLVPRRAAELTPMQRAALERQWQTWSAGAPYLDQGSTPRCVGYSFAHWLAAGPTINRGVGVTMANRVYARAQKIDEWPGEAYDGTSVRAGAKALREFGYIAEYRWAFTLAEVVDAILLFGPVVVGLNWYEGMDHPRGNVMRATGAKIGSHAFLLPAVDARKKLFRVKNSWGLGWAQRGTALLPFADFERLLREGGEACLAVEVVR